MVTASIHTIVSTTHHRVSGRKCNSSEACEFTGENTLGRETLYFCGYCRHSCRQKVHRTLARARFACQNVQKPTVSEHFWTLRSAKCAPNCRESSVCGGWGWQNALEIVGRARFAARFALFIALQNAKSWSVREHFWKMSSASYRTRLYSGCKKKNWSDHFWRMRLAKLIDSLIAWFIDSLIHQLTNSLLHDSLIHWFTGSINSFGQLCMDSFMSFHSRQPPFALSLMHLTTSTLHCEAKTVHPGMGRDMVKYITYLPW